MYYVLVGRVCYVVYNDRMCDEREYECCNEVCVSVCYFGGIIDIGIAEASTEHHPPEGLQSDATIEQIVPTWEMRRKGEGRREVRLFLCVKGGIGDMM